MSKGQLILSRRKNETIEIGDDIKLMVVEIRGDKVRLGIKAPKHVPVHRSEVAAAIRRDGNLIPPSPLARIANIIGNNLTLDAEQTAAIRELAGGTKS